MDPLSSLKIMTGPNLGAQLNGGLADSLAKSIPLQDLAKLNQGGNAAAAPAAPVASPVSSVGGTSGSFENMLGNFVGEVNAQQTAAGDAVSGLLGGKNVSLHQAMISMEEASVSFQMMVEVRNKLLDSYQEMMRMQI